MVSWRHGVSGKNIYFLRGNQENSLFYLSKTQGSTIVLFLIPNRLQAGVLGAVQVDENYLKRGLGTVVLKAITKQLAENGHDSSAAVSVDNVPSQALFKKAGFRKVDTAFWLRTLPVVPFEWSDE